MPINLDDINRIALRQTFLPWFREEMASMGVPLPPDWNPSDEVLGRLAEKCGEALAEYEAAS
jgi:hypothetical protein